MQFFVLYQTDYTKTEFLISAAVKSSLPNCGITVGHLRQCPYAMNTE